MTSRFDPNRNTLQSKFGFQDDDLKSSKHDEIMLWVDMNIERLLKPFMTNELWRIYVNADFELPPLPDKPEPKIMKKIWEHPVMINSFTVGFVDMMIKYGEPFPVINGIDYSYYGNKVSRKNGVIPYWSVEWTNEDPFHQSNGNLMKLIALEIKSELSTIGELIRQIRMYQTYLPSNTQFIVISPDDRFAPALQSQNIGFIKYEP